MLRTFSYGGGVQSTAALVLAARRVIDFPIHLFCNVGDDSEHPTTLRYVREVAMPYAEAHGIRLIELQRGGKYRSLLDRLVNGSERTIDIPVRMAGAGAPSRRTCTGDFKIAVVAKWQRQNGATKDTPAVAGLGISLDEFRRARTGSGFDYQTLEYPLLTMRLTRQDCINVIADAGLPIPPKSSCWFCPFRTLGAWQHQREQEPDLFSRSIRLEALLSARHEALGRGPVYFTSRLVPLDQATSPHRQLPMFADDQADACESGYCMT